MACLDFTLAFSLQCQQTGDGQSRLVIDLLSPDGCHRLLSECTACDFINLRGRKRLWPRYCGLLKPAGLIHVGLSV